MAFLWIRDEVTKPHIESDLTLIDKAGIVATWMVISFICICCWVGFFQILFWIF